MGIFLVSASFLLARKALLVVVLAMRAEKLVVVDREVHEQLSPNAQRIAGPCIVHNFWTLRPFFLPPDSRMKCAHAVAIAQNQIACATHTTLP